MRFERLLLVAPAALAALLAGCPAKVASVDVAPPKLELKGEGEERTLTATPKNEKGEEIEGKTAAWSTSDPAVASVDPATGKVRAIGSGSATITAKVDEAQGTATVNVVMLRSLKTDSPAIVVTQGASPTKINVAFMNERGEVIEGDYKPAWTSSDPNTVSVTPEGEVQGLQPGAATVTAKLNELKADVAVTVMPAAPPDGGPAGAVDGGAPAAAP